ncbi:nicotinamide riboside transporter PnuC [Serratia microhaemolytica]|uniref:nicotinamide riboside transporter PnuC n=1 Tax=Serratia microhaemolytica TaxID=2675110 RepID=UPI000FDEBE7E|nr:nicotinamide riboside transporter PnuC [Serratia microhaemolytica]
MKQALTWITKTPEGISFWSKCYLTIGAIIAIIVGVVTWESYWTTLAIFVSVGGYACVYYLGLRKNIGNVIGLVVNVGDGCIQFQYQAFGLAIAPVYYFMTHLIGLVSWNKHKDKDDKATLNHDKRSAFLSFIVFGVIGSAILFYLYRQDYFKEFSSFFFLMNILGMLIGIVAQGLMIMRFRMAWWGWFLANVFWLIINFMTGNWVYFFQTIWYQVNVLITLYDQYTLDD